LLLVMVQSQLFSASKPASSNL